MKIENIIDELLSHDMTKEDACKRIRDIVNSFRNKQSIELEVKSVGFSVHNNHGYITLYAPFGYENIKHINQGDKVDIIKLP